MLAVGPSDGAPKPHWHWHELSKLARMESGHTPSRKVPKYWGGDVPWVSVRDARLHDGGVISETIEMITQAGLDNSSARLLPAGTVCLSRTASIGYVVKAGRDLATSQGFVNWICSPKLDPNFLAYLLKFEGDFIEDLATGSTHKTLYYPEVKAFHVCIPPIDVQKRIVAVLDQAFAALDRTRALAEANLADAEELFENTLEAVFERLASSELILPLGEAVHPECRLSYGIVQPGDEVAGGLPIVRPVDLGRPIISLSGLKRISPKRAQGYSRTTLTGAELLLCVRGTTGEVSMASSELAGANVTRGIVPVRFDPAKVDLEFAYFQMRSPFMRKQITAKTYGAALMQINIKDVRELRFVRPSFDAQQKAKSEMQLLHHRANRMIGDYQAKLDDLGALRQSLFQKAFAGELT